MFSKTAEKRLRAAGWFPERSIPDVTLHDTDFIDSQVRILREFGRLSIHSGVQQALIFRPDVDAGKRTYISSRTVSREDLEVESAVWKATGIRRGAEIRGIGWEKGQDEHSIAVDQDGTVFSATWQPLSYNKGPNAEVMKLADTIYSYLNFWLDPTHDNRKKLHVLTPSWFENIPFSTGGTMEEELGHAL